MTLKLSSTPNKTSFINIPPLNYSHYLNQGYKSHRQAHHLDNAALYYDAAITIRPYRSQAYYNRALLMLQQRNIQAAFSDINAAISAQYLKLGMLNPEIKSYLQLSTRYSSNNYLAESVISSMSKIKPTEPEWRYKIKEEGETGTMREQDPIYPGNDYRLNGLCSSQMQCLDLQRLFGIYREICTQNIEGQQKDKNSKKEILAQNKNNKQIIQQTVDLVIYPTAKDDVSPFLQLPGKTEERFSINIQEFNPIHSQTYENSLNDQSFEIMTASHYTQNSFSLIHRFCHNGCLKCKKKHNNKSLYVLAGSGFDNQQKMLRIEIKTVQIYRFALKNPKTYLIFNQSDEYGVFGEEREVPTQVDYEGGYFPNWGTVCFYADQDYLKGQQSEDKENKANSTKKCKIELWQKETKSDSLIGAIKFRPKIGRCKWQLSRIEGCQAKKKHTGYLILDIRK